MSAKIVVHVGAHKTGTSLIQKYMRDKPEQLTPFGVRAVSRSDTNTLIGWGQALIDTRGLATSFEARRARRPTLLTGEVRV